MPGRKIQVTFGPPGTGKTTAMLNRIDDMLQRGIEPNRIAFVSYTKKAVQEAVARASEKFNIDARELTHFRTIHSMAYHAMRVRRNDVMSRADYREITKLTGLRFTGYDNMMDGLSADSGDSMLSLISYSNATRRELHDVWRQFGDDSEWFKLKQLSDVLNQYKNDMDKVDFDDMLLLFARERPIVDVDAVIIDEAQDLSNLQWDVAKTAFRNAQSIDIAGDDDQAIYGWSGANVQRFLGIAGKSTVLDKSYRLPVSVFKTATGILKQIHQRKEKTWRPRDEEGSVQYTTDATMPNNTDETWLMLARNNYFLEAYREALIYEGIPFVHRSRSSIDPDEATAIKLYVGRQHGKPLDEEQTKHLVKYTKCTNNEVEWYEALDQIDLPRREYYLSALRKGYKLDDEPKCTISSIHGVKGGEADNVVLRTDMTARSYDAMDVDADNEHRVFYVGATRARNNLFIVQPQTDRGYLL